MSAAGDLDASPKPTLLEDLTEFVERFPHATVRNFYDRFGTPIHDVGACGSYKTYTDMVFLRDGQFVQVRHRDFGNEQYIALREVEPVERVRVDVVYTPAHPADSEGDTFTYKTPIVPNTSAIMDALRR